MSEIRFYIRGSRVWWQPPVTVTCHLGFWFGPRQKLLSCKKQKWFRFETQAPRPRWIMAQEPEPESVNIQMISIVNHLFTPAQISPDRRYQVYRWYSASGKCNNVQKGWVDYLHFPPSDDIKTISPGSGWGPVTKEAVSDLWLHLAYLAISELSSELAGLPPCSTRWIWAIKDTTNREGREGRDGQMPAQSPLSAHGSFWAQEWHICTYFERIEAVLVCHCLGATIYCNFPP